MNTGFNGMMIDQLLAPADEKEKEEDELEIERKYYQKPNTDPMANNFLQKFYSEGM